MPDTDEYDDQDPDDENQEPEGSQRRRKPSKAERELRRQNEELAEQLAGERKARVFSDVGIPDTPKFRYFRNAYDGEMTPEAVRTAAVEAELMEPPPPDTPPEELAAHDQIAGASAGASSPSGKLRISSEEYVQRVAAAKDPDELMRIMQEAGSPIASQ